MQTLIFILDFQANLHNQLVVEPTHLKNMLVKVG